MLNLNQSEIAALQLVLSQISLKELLINSQKGFDENNDTNSTAKAELIYNSIKAFL